MSRPAEVVIDLSAIRENLDIAKLAAPNTKAYAIIKADGYGHGIICTAYALRDADGFGVASIDEALQLRARNIQKPILLLEGIFDQLEFEEIIQHNLEIVLHHKWQLHALQDWAVKPSSNSPPAKLKQIDIWLKLDTGMNRLGFAPKDIYSIWNVLKKNPLIRSIKLMTHLANADDVTDNFTENQLVRFESATQNINTLKSIANSAAVLAWPQAHAEIIRPGIMLYGASPFIKTNASDFKLKPAMTLQSKLIAIKELKKGNPVGYGGDWTAPYNTRIGIVAIGYGDGYPRHAPSGTPVLVGGNRTQLVGRVSMDLLCVDLGKLPSAKIGDNVVLWGKGLPVEEVAQHAETISYELFCGITKRVKRSEKQ